MMSSSRGRHRYCNGGGPQFCRSMGYRALGRVVTMVDCRRGGTDKSHDMKDSYKFSQSGDRSRDWGHEPGIARCKTI